MDLLGAFAEKDRNPDPTYPESNGRSFEGQAPAVLLARLPASLSVADSYIDPRIPGISWQEIPLIRRRAQDPSA
jgi:hypothetical protein